jgi:energy-coupling factor transporter ATP-binding protein EcfA2
MKIAKQIKEEQEIREQTNEKTAPTRAVREKAEDTKKDKPIIPQAKRLVTLIVENPAISLWHDEERQGYLSIRKETYEEHISLNNSEFKYWAVGLYYENYDGMIVNDSAIKSARNYLIYLARENEQHIVYRRIATLEDRIYIDLCDSEYRVVEITAKQGWKIVHHPPVKFLRTDNMLPLPEPRRKGSFDLFRDFVRTDDKSFRLIEGFLLKCFYSLGAYPILLIFGEQGSGKSYISRLLKRIIDPNIGDTRNSPSEIKDLYAAAKSNLLLVYDNISYVNNELSDAFCSLATGNAFGGRKLFSDNEEHITKVKRPVIMNGIADIGSQPDFMDRALSVTLQKIEDTKRLPEKELERKFNEILPFVTGALYDKVANGMANMGSLPFERLPRLADLAEWVTACEPENNRGEFVNYIFENREEIQTEALLNDPVGLAMYTLMENRSYWEGNSTDLLFELTQMQNIPHGKNFPTEVRSFGNKLKRLHPLLAQANIFIEKKAGHAGRIITIVKNDPTVQIESQVNNVTQIRNATRTTGHTFENGYQEKNTDHLVSGEL